MKYNPSIAFDEMSGSAKGVTAAKCGVPSAGSPKVFFKYFFVNTATGEKSGDVLAQAKLTNE